jgi:hypothetical protein
MVSGTLVSGGLRISPQRSQHALSEAVVTVYKGGILEGTIKSSLFLPSRLETLDFSLQDCTVLYTVCLCIPVRSIIRYTLFGKTMKKQTWTGFELELLWSSTNKLSLSYPDVMVEVWKLSTKFGFKNYLREIEMLFREISPKFHRRLSRNFAKNSKELRDFAWCMTSVT